MNQVQEQLLESALQAGASHAEVYQARSFSRPVSFEGNRLKQLESTQSEGTALRLWRDRSPGLAVAYGEVEPAELVAKAIAISQLNPPEEIELNDARTDIYEATGENVAVEKLVELGKNAIAHIRDTYPEVICSAGLECERETTTLINSQGLHCEYTDVSTSYYLGVEWVRGEDFLGVYEGEETETTPDLKTTINSILQRLEWAHRNAKAPQGKVPILFTPNAATMLWSTVADALNGKRIVEGSSPWSESLGKLAIAPDVTLSQQPDEKPYGCPFDDEGTPTKTLTLINRGYVETFYSDRTTARALGTITTGNGFRPSLGRYPTPDLVNLVVANGRGSLSNLVGQIESGILVDRILGGGADISGDFSVNIDLGYLIRNGEIIGRVKDTMVAGNVYQALKQIIALGADRQWEGSYYTPSIIVDGLSVISS